MSIHNQYNYERNKAALFERLTDLMQPGEYVKLKGKASDHPEEASYLSIEQKRLLHTKNLPRREEYFKLLNSEQDARDDFITRIAVDLENPDYSPAKNLISVLDDLGALDNFLNLIGENLDWNLNDADEIIQEHLDPETGNSQARDYVGKCLEGVFNVELKKKDLATAYKILDLVREYGLKEPDQADFVDIHVELAETGKVA